MTHYFTEESGIDENGISFEIMRTVILSPDYMWACHVGRGSLNK